MTAPGKYIKTDKTQCTEIDRPVKSLKFLFELTRALDKYSLVYFYGLFWGEQQPFVSSGYGGLYFLQACNVDPILDS